MAHAFVQRADGLFMCRLDAEEKAVLAQVAQEVSELVHHDLRLADEPGTVRRAADSSDPLERLEAEFAARDAQEPSDPAVRRLLPAASEDPALAEEMRRLGQADLVAAKLAALGRIQSTLDASGPLRTEVVLDPEDARAWVSGLTDLRLVLAERLGLRSDQDAETLHMLQQIEADAELDAPRTTSNDGEPGMASGDLVLAVYDLLTWLQESLVRVLMLTMPEEDGPGH